MTTSQQPQGGSGSFREETAQRSNQISSTLHPSFLPPCSHASGGDEGLHAHAFDLLALNNPSMMATIKTDSVAIPARQTQPRTVSASVSTGIQRPRRMSSSTTAALGRGKTGLLGTSVGNSGEPSGLGLGGISRSSGRVAPSITRRTSSSTNPAPVLFDFAKTDSTRRPVAPVHSYSQPGTRNGKFGASLPATSAGYLVRATEGDSMELDMSFDDDDDEVLLDDEEAGSGSAEREGSAEDAENKPAYEKLALGTGSGGVKGRRKGMVFKCENCSKEYRHPSCLVKHRWEHSPHWKEPTQLSMSKHQQVQMLEAAAILMHMDPTAAPGRLLPSDKSLWPAVLSPPPTNAALTRSGRSSTRELPNVRSPPMTSAPLTPSSLRTGSPMVNGRPHRQSFGQASDQGRKTSPGSDSTTSSTGFENQEVSNGSQPQGIDASRRGSSLSSSIPNLATPNSVGSMPDMSGLHFHSGTTPVSRNTPLPGPASRVGMVGGGMFGLSGSYGLNASVPRSSVSSVRGNMDGALQEESEEEDHPYRRGYDSRGKSSSEEIEEQKAMHSEEDGWAAGTGMDLDMEL